MIKRTFTSALVAVALSACQSNNAEQQNKAAENAAIPTTKVYDVRDVNFLTPEQRTARYGEDWKNNPAITRHIKPDVAVEMDMSDSRSINLQYEKQFALHVKADNPEGYGAVSIQNKWVKVGDSVTIKAKNDDNATFNEWIGDTEGAEITGDTITIKMDRPRNIAAAFLSNNVKLQIDSKFGEPVGSGTYGRGSKVAWSVNSPVALNETERMVAREKTGSAVLDDNKKISLVWEHEFLVQSTSNGNGSVESPAGWMNHGEEITLMATPKDDNYEFVKWEGISDELSQTNPVTIAVDGGVDAKAIFLKKEFDLKINSAHGEITGTGLHARGSEVTWSVSSPTEDIKGIRFLAVPATGTTVLDSDQEINVNWVEQVLVKVIKKSGDGQELLGTYWLNKGDSIDNITVPVKDGETFFWAGDIQTAQIENAEVDIIADKPKTVIADFNPKPNTLTITSNEGQVISETKNEYYSHQKATNNIPGTIYNSPAERNVLDVTPLKGQIKEFDKIAMTHTEAPDMLEKGHATITFTDFMGWKNCISLASKELEIIVSPEVGRVVYLGTPGGKENALWVNEDIAGQSFSRDDTINHWNDIGGSRVWIAPVELNHMLLKREFPPAYEFDGAPAAELTASLGKVILTSRANANFGCAIERTFEVKHNQLIVATKLLAQEGKAKHNFSVGPATFTQFKRPSNITLGKSIFPEMHPSGYVMFNGELAEPTVQDEFISFKVPAPSNDGWKIGSHTASLRMSYPSFTLSAKATVIAGEEVCEQNTNFQVTSPEESMEYIEVSHIGSMNQLSQVKTSEVTWTYSKK
ncbi:hypothetical protein PQO03_14535 [Lentisphaera profundi]|uniref:Bacterial repeat domain-containing protein n=1 Tax=Lentisphaera profundi TaxID=1658616 RepID=A0ABY7VXR2_9BACT|nr:hypothetical protein [Lentisphaera profundi]WDE99051.1 hypothetical protein PQO03_14535 [Lentisphaera profundi]